ncbi:MAG: hypothetical protein ACHREM_01455 [Polyangiales bacterium]
MAFTAAKAQQVTAMAERAKAQMAKVRETTEEAIGDGILAVETSATAYGIAYAHMRWGEGGELKVLGVPVDLGVATALGGLAALGGFGKYKEHGRNVGVGALTLFAGRMGAEAGAKAARDDHDDAYKRTLASGGKPASGLGAGSASSGTPTGAGTNYVVAEKP